MKKRTDGPFFLFLSAFFFLLFSFCCVYSTTSAQIGAIVLSVICVRRFLDKSL